MVVKHKKPNMAWLYIPITTRAEHFYKNKIQNREIYKKNYKLITNISSDQEH